LIVIYLYFRILEDGYKLSMNLCLSFFICAYLRCNSLLITSVNKDLIGRL